MFQQDACVPEEALYSLLVSLLMRSGEIVLTFLPRCLFFYAMFSYRTCRGTASRLFYLPPHPAFGSLFFFTSSPPVFIFEGKKDCLSSEGWGLVICVCVCVWIDIHVLPCLQLTLPLSVSHRRHVLFSGKKNK